MTDGLLQKAVELVELGQKDRFVQELIMRTLTNHKTASLGHLASTEPELFDELYDTCKLMVKELPWI